MYNEILLVLLNGMKYPNSNIIVFNTSQNYLLKVYYKPFIGRILFGF